MESKLLIIAIIFVNFICGFTCGRLSTRGVRIVEINDCTRCDSSLIRDNGETL